MTHIIEDQDVDYFVAMLKERERSAATIEVYTRSVELFRKWTGPGAEFDKKTVIAYKDILKTNFKLTSANAYIVALNSFFKCMEWQECCLTTYSLQRRSFRDAGKELSLNEYKRILEAAKERQNDRLFYIIQTIAGTGIRIGELPYITVEALKQKRACIYNKRKYREILIPSKLCDVLLDFCKRHGIQSGSIFITRNGNSMERSNILHMMKELSEQANVPREKLFPHNFRHFFAVNYYDNDRDIVRLADLLGHASLNTTRIYTQISVDQQMSILDRMDSRYLYC